MKSEIYCIKSFVRIDIFVRLALHAEAMLLMVSVFPCIKCQSLETSMVNTSFLGSYEQDVEIPSPRRTSLPWHPSPKMLAKLDNYTAMKIT